MMLTLEKMNRPQKTESVCTVSHCSSVYSNLSSDLIIGLPGVTEQVWHRTIKTALEWDSKHMSIYFLTVHQNTQLYHGVKAGSIKLPHDDAVLTQYGGAIPLLEQRGLSQYEIFQILHGLGMNVAIIVAIGSGFHIVVLG